MISMIVIRATVPYPALSAVHSLPSIFTPLSPLIPPSSSPSPPHPAPPSSTHTITPFPASPSSSHGLSADLTQHSIPSSLDPPWPYKGCLASSWPSWVEGSAGQWLLEPLSQVMTGVLETQAHPLPCTLHHFPTCFAIQLTSQVSEGCNGIISSRC